MIRNNNCNHNHPLDKEYLRNLAKNSTEVVAWYPHSKGDGYHPGRSCVRGPFGRWMLIEGGDNGMGDPVRYPTPVADLDDDAKFAAAAMNNMVPLLDEIDRLEAEIGWLKSHAEDVRASAEIAEMERNLR
jgi:hypothetical protein